VLEKYPSEVKPKSKVIPRTEGVTQAMIINRVLKAQETFKKEVAEDVMRTRVRRSSGNAVTPQPQQVQSFWRQLGWYFRRSKIILLGSWNINFQQWRTDVINQR
jgi:hypothetical protein